MKMTGSGHDAALKLQSYFRPRLPPLRSPPALSRPSNTCGRKPEARLGFGQLAFPYDTFVRFVDTLDPILILAGTLRQLLGDHINTAEGVAADYGRELYALAGAKFVVRHGVNTPRRKPVYHNCGRRVSGHHNNAASEQFRLDRFKAPSPTKYRALT